MYASIPIDYEYINENDIDDELKCVICKQPLESPVSLSICHHTFCKQCIQLWLDQTGTCPVCRQETFRRINRSSVYVPLNTRIVLNQLDRLRIRCLLCNETNLSRCGWKNHQEICSKKLISCPSADIKCRWKGLRNTLAVHLNHCTFQQVRPIIDELKNDLKLAKTTQTELQNSVNTLENKVAFLLKVINHGNVMIQHCTKPKNDCKYYMHGRSDRRFRFICSICHKRISREQVALHDCSGDCICRSCVSSQYPDRFQTWESSDKEEEDDD